MLLRYIIVNNFTVMSVIIIVVTMLISIIVNHYFLYIYRTHKNPKKDEVFIEFNETKKRRRK